jgi:hypothetical protein
VFAAISGLATFAIMALSGVVGTRLVRLGGRTGGPERWLGFYFLLYGVAATVFVSAVYTSWSDASVRIPDAALAVLNALFYASATVGLVCLMRFTQRTFRPISRLARSAVSMAAGVFVLSALDVGFTEGFRPHVLNGAGYWIHYLVRLSAWVWVTVESFRYWTMQRRRLARGLADPKVANRLLLWSVWGALSTLLALIDPVARVWYWLVTGTTDRWLPAAAQPIIAVIMPVASLLSVASAVALLLTFFPGAAYRRWILARHPARP